MICDYTALTAWGTVGGGAATFLAVLVALFYPIFSERKRKQERARNLRERLLVAAKGIILTSMKRRLRIAETEEDKEFAAEFKMLFPQTTLLIRQEQDDVKKLYTLLSASPGWPTKTAESHLREIREAAREAVKTLGGA